MALPWRNGRYGNAPPIFGRMRSRRGRRRSGEPDDFRLPNASEIHEIYLVASESVPCRPEKLRFSSVKRGVLFNFVHCHPATACAKWVARWVARVASYPTSKPLIKGRE
jgi:hypothetical protein